MSHYLLHGAARCRAADDDAACLLGGGGTVETVDAGGGGRRRRRGGACLDAVRLSLEAQELLACGSHIGQERGTGMQTGKDTACRPRSVSRMLLPHIYCMMSWANSAPMVSGGAGSQDTPSGRSFSSKYSSTVCSWADSCMRAANTANAVKTILFIFSQSFKFACKVTKKGCNW